MVLYFNAIVIIVCVKLLSVCWVGKATATVFSIDSGTRKADEWNSTGIAGKYFFGWKSKGGRGEARLARCGRRVLVYTDDCLARENMHCQGLGNLFGAFPVPPPYIGGKVNGK